MSDRELLERAGRGDQAAFFLLYQNHRDIVFRFAYRMTGSVELAEDITHDCFLSLVKRPARFDPARASLRTYLYAATRNLALKYFRDTGHEVLTDELPEEPALLYSSEPLRRLLEEEVSAEVQRAVADLPPLQREALVLFEYEELPLDEIASIAGVDVGAIKARLHRARARLRRSLAPLMRANENCLRPAASGPRRFPIEGHRL